jgi:hypothetical protein
MRAAEKFHLALSYAVVLLVTLIVIAGIFVPMMVEQGGLMAAAGIPVMGLCMGYLVSMGMLRMIQAYKRMIRSRD